MDNFYLSGVGFFDGLFLPLFYFLGLWVPPDPEALQAQGIMDGFITVMAWVGFLHDTSIFPLYFILTFDLLLFSFLASLVMAFLRWLMDVIPFA